MITLSPGRRLTVLSSTGLVTLAGTLDVFKPPYNFDNIAVVALCLFSPLIPCLVIVIMTLELILGKYGRRIVPILVAAPALAPILDYLSGSGSSGYALTLAFCFVGWAAVWFVTSPRTS